MINLESIEIHNDSNNEEKINKKKKLNSSKKNIFETESDNQTDKSKDDSSKINIDDIIVGYPKTSDPDLQSKIYAKREFYYYKLPNRPDLTSYKEIEEYRKKICLPTGELLEHQALLSNFINPDTPYKGLLVFHGTGTGKTCAAIAAVYMS